LRISERIVCGIGDYLSQMNEKLKLLNAIGLDVMKDLKSMVISELDRNLFERF
jgi:hypothetical protein